VVAERVNLLGLRGRSSRRSSRALGAKPFRAAADEMDLSKGRRGFFRHERFEAGVPLELQGVAAIEVPEIVTEQRSTDGTRKWMLRMDEVQGIETVYIPEPDRGTLCISSQLDAPWTAPSAPRRRVQPQPERRRDRRAGVARAPRTQGHRPDGGDHQHRVHGHGEPLANYRNVVPAMRIFLDDLGYDLSRRR